MTELTLFQHTAFADHLVPSGHPERPDRIKAINAMLDAEFPHLSRLEPPQASRDDINLAHETRYTDFVFDSAPQEGLVSLDGDTVMSPGTLTAALAGAGGAIAATRMVLENQTRRAFVASRPPGHHAEPAQAMGFCFFSNAAIAAKYAIEKHGLDRVAVVDFDVHHANGTQAVFWSDSRCVLASSHQMPLYPGTGAKNETGCGNIFNAPLAAGDAGDVIIELWRHDLLPKVADMRPQLIIISAGFDAHRNDPLGGLMMQADDFATLTTMIAHMAEQTADGRIVSILEGGYDLDGLTRSCAAHLGALAGSSPSHSPIA